MIIFSFGSAILRAIGDTRRPLIYMIIAGVVNVLLNLFFVLVCKIDVAGVAIATKASNVLSAFLVLRALTKSHEGYRLRWKMLHIRWDIIKEMLRIGVPAGIQGMLYSISNLLIQSSVNSFGWQSTAGNTAALNLEGIVHVAFSSFGSAVVSFVGQNHGAKKYKRIARTIWLCLGCGMLTAIVLGGTTLLFKRQLLGIYNSDPGVIDFGVLRMNYQLPFYFLVAGIEVLTGALRGLGHSVGPTIISLLGACLLRVVWIFTLFRIYPTLDMLMISYPVSWFLVFAATGYMLFVICRKMMKRAILSKSVKARV